jgi:hypothetical protein
MIHQEIKYQVNGPRMQIKCKNRGKKNLKKIQTNIFMTKHREIKKPLIMLSERDGRVYLKITEYLGSDLYEDFALM